MIINNLNCPIQNFNTKTQPAIKQKQMDALSSDSVSINQVCSSKIKGAYGLIGLRNVDRKNQISFMSRPLYSINLKKMMPDQSYEYVKANFSELSKRSKKDIQSVLALKQNWANKTKYGDYIANDFLSESSGKYNCYVTEVTSKEMPPEEKITCIMQVAKPKKTRKKNVFKINFIQSSPDIANVKLPKYKGSGELSLYGAIKVAQQKGYKKIRVISFNDDFYKKMGFKKIASIGKNVSYFELDSKRFDYFLQRVSKKYNLT